MTEGDRPADASPPDNGAPAEPAKKGKKKKKAREAWITFAGRIVAQLVGAAATIFLGIWVVGRVNDAPRRSETASVIAPGAPARAARRPGGAATIAVLPLDNFSGDPQQDYFADGMTEALIAQLAQVRDLRVISRTSVMQYKGRPKALPEIAWELGVDLIVEGSVVKSGDRIRVTAQLIEASRDEHVWAQSYDRQARDVLALQAEIAAAIAREVSGAAVRVRQTLAREAVDPTAYDLYLRGRHAWSARTREGYDEAIRYFTQSIAADPSFALAHAGLADTYQLMGQQLVDGSGPAKAFAAVREALRLDDGIAEAHTSLAGLLHRSDGNVAAAEREFKRALELNAGYATAHQWYAILLAEEGRDGEALQHAQEAVARDPLSGPMRQTLTLVHYYGRRFSDAVTEGRRTLDLAPQLTLPRDMAGRSLLALARPREALDVARASPAPTPDLLATMAIAHLRLGDTGAANRVVADLTARKTVPVLGIVRWHVATGDSTKALEALERAVTERPTAVQQLKSDPALDPLRRLRRFQEILRRAQSSQLVS